MDIELLYHKTPVLVQNSLVSFGGWRTVCQRFGKTFEQLLGEYEQRQTWSREDIERFRDERLHDFVLHCEKHVPYYRCLFKRLKISARDIRGLADLRVLPVLDKTTVQERYREFLAENIPRSQRLIVHTSGTTGGGLRFASTKQALSEQWAVWWRYRRTHGLDRSVWHACFAGRSVVPLQQRDPPFWRVNFPGRQILFSGYHMNPRNLAAYVDELRRRRPPWLHGYPSLLALIASYVLDRDLSLDFPVRWITTGAESLLPQQAELMRRAFGVHPVQHYGMAEAVANISEDSHGFLRIDEDFAAVEFLSNDEGPGYRIVGTNLSNPATPLLRYDTTDLAELPADTVDDGTCGGTVLSLDGRREDYVVLRNGAVLGRLDHIFKDLVRIREAQVFQKEPGKIQVRVVRGTGYTSVDESQLLREFKKRVGDQASVDVQYVPSLPRSPAGKLRFVVSELPAARTA